MGGPEFAHKTGGVGKIGELLQKKEVSPTVTNFSKVIFFSVWFVCLANLYHFHRYSLYHRKDLVLLNLVSRYMTSTTEHFLKRKDNVDICRIFQ